ncbi:MAG: DUF4185 domain-containing protein [Bacilli bacterium]|nr:DUF4185 domain-containing protein [Bacilli bacterium]MBR1582045.1 DUF4185 domain-containing protein [Bacilli bacterium]
MKFTYDSSIEYVKFNSFVSGKNSPTPTLKWDVYGTDLGIPCYSEKEKKLLLFFGDTFSTPLPSDENWRGTVIGKVSNFNFENGIHFESFVSDEKGNAINLIKHHKCKNSENFEVTKICQGCVEVNGVLYAFYESIRSWGEPGYWNVNYTGTIKSYDFGNTWERCYDLTWVGKIDTYEENIKHLVSEDINMNETTTSIDINKHHSEAFSQIYPYKYEGYVYIFGRRGGRQFGVTLGKVKENKIEDFDEYEYLVNINNKKQWVKGTTGLKLLNDNEQESYIIPLPVSNITISYNNFIKKFIALYYKPSVGVVFRTSSSIEGPYEKEILLIKQNDEHLPAGKEGLYGGFTHDIMTSENGQIVYFIVSQWNKNAYLSELFEFKFKG